MKQKINVPTIPLPEAQARIERFRRKFAGSVPESNIPRAILIPIEDVMAIIGKYQTVNGNGDPINEIKGIRAYFSVKESDQELPNDVTALIVAVDLKGNDIVMNDSGLGATDSSEIYDFTTPCPTECDVDSPLFVP